MMALRQLAPPTAELYGPARTVIIYVVGGIVGFTLSSCAALFLPAFPFLHGSLYTVGASASLCGLIGSLLYYGHRTGSSIVRSEATRYIVMLAVYGLIMPGIDNYAHAGGIGGGYLVGMLLDPMKSERGDHMLIAVVLLALGAPAHHRGGIARGRLVSPPRARIDRQSHARDRCRDRD